MWVIYLSSDEWHKLLIRVGLNVLELVVPGLVAVVQVLDLLLQQTTTNCDALPCKHICYKSIKLCLGPDSDSLLNLCKVSLFCVKGLCPTHSNGLVSHETADAYYDINCRGCSSEARRHTILDVGGDQSSLLFVQLDSTIGFRSEAAAYKDCEATSLLTPPPGRGRELRI